MDKEKIITDFCNNYNYLYYIEEEMTEEEVRLVLREISRKILSLSNKTCDGEDIVITNGISEGCLCGSCWESQIEHNGVIISSNIELIGALMYWKDE